MVFKWHVKLVLIKIDRYKIGKKAKVAKEMKGVPNLLVKKEKLG